MKIKNFVKYFKEGVLKYFKISMSTCEQVDTAVAAPLL